MHSAFTTIRASMRSADHLGLDDVRSLQQPESLPSKCTARPAAVGMMVLRTGLPARLSMELRAHDGGSIRSLNTSGMFHM